MTRNNGLALVHRLPKRLRYTFPLLGDPTVDLTYVEAYLEAIEGVHAVRINCRAVSVIVEYDGRRASRHTITQHLASLSRQAAPRLPQPASRRSVDLSQLISSALPLVLLPFLSRPLRAMLTFASLTPTFCKGVNALLTPGSKVEALDATAVGLAAWRGDYFTANATHCLLKVGEYLEYTTERQSDLLLKQLLHPVPMQAWVEREGTLLQLPCTDLRAGDRVVVGVGEFIPIDGRVIQGAALVNQASLTGESLPITKEPGEHVLSGTVVVEGRITIWAERVGDQTTTARITRVIEESLRSRPATQRLADLFAERRVYLTLGMGALVFALTRDIRRLAAVFLVDYSCAIKLSPPIAFKSSMYRAATQGTLVKGGQALEDLAQADTVVFDKTGTLTYGALEITDIHVLQNGPWSEDHLLALAASVEEHSNHPIAEAVVHLAKRKALSHIEHDTVDFIVAHGLRTHSDGQAVLVGSRHFLEEHEGVSFTDYEPLIRDLEAQGKTLLYLATAHTPLGLIALRDRVRAEASETLQWLRALGVTSLVLLTGDQRSKALSLATQLGMDEVYADMEPAEKARIVQQLQEQGRKVAFVGDGVNDAPALVAADVGIAMPRAADIARVTADIVLLEDRLGAVAEAKALADRTMQRIHTNFKLAVGINSAILVGAALGWLSPITTALLHNGTTISILLRALSGVSQHSTRPPA